MTISASAISLLMFAATTAAEDEKPPHFYEDDDLQLDCTLGFDNLKTSALEIEGIELLSQNETQVAYGVNPISFTITKEGHPAHPMILRRDILVDDDDKVDVKMAACGYGSKEDADKVVKKFRVMNEQFLLKYKLRLKDETKKDVEAE
ncbi:MAG: hypothetical protein AAGD92_01720 [Pseudomonadota bacterium]